MPRSKKAGGRFHMTVIAAAKSLALSGERHTMDIYGDDSLDGFLAFADFILKKRSARGSFLVIDCPDPEGKFETARRTHDRRPHPTRRRGHRTAHALRAARRHEDDAAEFVVNYTQIQRFCREMG
jgi:hypothetical protein